MQRSTAHVVFESIALVSVVPFSVYLATRKRLPMWARATAGAFAAGTLIVDGALLVSYLRNGRKRPALPAHGHGEGEGDHAHAPGEDNVPSEYPPEVGTRTLTNANVDTHGFVHALPQTLAAEMGLDLETSALARMLGSEWASGNPREKASVAWTIVNEARQRGWSLLRLATTVCCGPRGRKRCHDEGLYGAQDMGGHCAGGNRYVSTARNPTERDAWVASMIMAGAWPDITGGADQFFNPEAQEALRARDPSTYDSPEAVIARWTASGRKRVYPTPDGVDPDRLVLVGPA